MAIDLLPGLSDVGMALVRVGAWQVLFATLLFSIIWLLIRLLRIRSPRVRHALWALVLIRLVLPPDFALPFGVGSLIGDRLSNQAEELRIHFIPQISYAVDGDIAAAADKGGRGNNTPAVSLWASGAVLLWMTGSLIVALVWLHIRRKCHRILRHAQPVDDVRLQSLLRDWRRRLRIRRPIRLVTSASVRVPFTLGSIRPVIVVPAPLTSDENLEVVEVVLAHEAVHVKRWDDLLLQLETVVSALYFFFPLAWMTAKRMRDEREHICDEIVLSHERIAPKTYGRGLLTVLRLGLGNGHLHVPAFASARARLEARLKAVNAKTKSRRPKATLMLAATTLLGLFLLPMSRGGAGPIPADRAEHRSLQDIIVWENPLPNAEITSRFGVRFNPIRQAPDHHNGIDVRRSGNPPVAAAADGRVEVATTTYRENEGYGTVVILDHGNGFETVYAHLDSLAVQEGARVTAGQVVGFVGSTGITTGPHLHFEVRQNGEPIDPARFVAEWR